MKYVIVFLSFIMVSCYSINAPHGGTTGWHGVAGDALKSYVEGTCSYCKGTGQKDCLYCDGTGQKECISCDGSGLGMTCALCDGAGRTYSEYFGWSRCYSCNGRGYYKCVSCNGRGWRKCYSCNGRRWKKCNWCNGRGYMK